MAGPSTSAPSVLFRASRIYAGDPPQPGPTAMLVEGERVAWVGGEPPPNAGATVDLGDAVVIPGLIDCHFHMLCLLPTAGWADLRAARSLRDARRIFGAHAGGVPEGRWAVGWGFDAAKAAGRRLKRPDLDAISPDRPALIVETSLHQGSLNSAALAALGWGRSTPRWHGGRLERDRRGEPNGVVWEGAFGVPMLKAMEAELETSPEAIAQRMRAMAADLLAQGVTHMAEAFTPPALVSAFESARLPLGVTMMPTSGRGLLSPPSDALAGPRTGSGDLRLGVGPVKLVADGAEQAAMCLPLPRMGAVTAAALARAVKARDFAAFRLLASVAPNRRGWKVRTGIPHYSRSALAEITAAALGKGFGVAIHAIGNEAIDMTLDAFDQGRRATGRDLSGCRIEHAMFARPRDLERAARLGVILSMQPGHAVHYGPTAHRIGLDTVFEPVPIRWAVEAGCRVALSSDAPTIPSTALQNLRAAVDRIDVEGRPVAPGQAISPAEALRATTAGGAEACGLEDVKGSLAPGKLADFAVLSGDPFEAATRVTQTWVAGRKVWPG